MRPARCRLRLAGWLMMLVLAVLLGACGGDGETADEGTTDETAETDEAATSDGDRATDDSGDMASSGGVTLELAESDVGEHVVDSEGNTLYLFTNDTQGSGESSCTGGCQETWPPLTTDGEVSVAGGLDSELVGTITREDGSQQVTYNGWPLYHFAGDENPGDVNGQGSGGVWFVVDASGQAIQGS